MNSAGEYFVVFSNLAIIPAIVISLVHGKIASAGLLTSVGTVSTIYHLCQSNFFCIFQSNIKGERNYRLLQDSDEFLVSVTIAWFVMYFLEIEKDVAVAFIFLLLPVFTLSTLSGTSSLHLIIAVAIVLLIGGMLLYGLIKMKTIAFNLWYGLAAVALLIIGFIFFYIGEDPDGNRYNNFHSLWHIFLMFAVFFVILTKNRENVFIPLVNPVDSSIKLH